MVVWAADIHADGRAQFGPLLLADLRLALSALASQSQHIEELATRIATLEEGLGPFSYVRPTDDDSAVVYLVAFGQPFGLFLMGEAFRRARTLLAGKEAKDG